MDTTTSPTRCKSCGVLIIRERNIWEVDFAAAVGEGADHTHAPDIPAGLWPQISAQLAEIAAGADTFDDVRAILTDAAYADVRRENLRNGENPTAIGTDPDAAFFAGGGGDETLLDALYAAGWTGMGTKASYHYAMWHPATGDTLTYTEGDVTRGDSLNGEA